MQRITQESATTAATAATTPATTPAPNATRSLFVVGIGASAGGLEALERFFENVPIDSGMAFVVIQHLSPDFKSLMDEILARRTSLPIHLSEDGMPVEANHVYLIPPKKQMIISGGKLLLSERGRDQEMTLPIDIFFRSLAHDCGAHAIAVVLSGGGSDGSRGIRAVHEAGGLVLVQDFETAQFDGMPKTARDAGVADHVLPPQAMPEVIVAHALRGGVPEHRPSDVVPGMHTVYKMLEEQFGIDAFVVTLPLSAAADSYLLNEPAHDKRVKLAKGSRIVVIEDNADSREMLCDLLIHVGLDCRSCDDGEAALVLIDEFEPRAAIIDIGLPGMDGLELARRLRESEQHRGIHLIALTGYGQRADRVRALEAGFDEHLVKPTGFDVLKRLIAEGPNDGSRVDPLESN